MSSLTATTLVPIQHSTGVQITAHIPVEKRSTRLQTRLQTLTKYVSRYPRGWKKRLELADVLYHLGEWSQAVQEYRLVLHRQPQLLSVRLRTGTLLCLLHRFDEAIALYQSALEGETEPAAYQHIQGLIHECEQSDVAATIAFQKAIDAESSNMAHWHALAQSYAKQDDFEKAIHTYDHILELNPNDAIAISWSANLLWELEAYAESIARTEKVLELIPEHAPAIKRIVDHRCRIGLLKGDEGKETVRLLKQLQKLAPKTPEAFQSQAYHDWYTGQTSTGKALLAHYCQDSPRNPFGLFYNALFLFHIGALEEAADCIWDAYQLYPKHVGIFEALCEILPRVKRTASVDLILNQRLEASRNQWQIHLIAGRFLAQYHSGTQRSSCLGKHAIELKPNIAQAWFQYGEILALCQDYQPALKAIETGWELLPKQWFSASSLTAAAKMAECHQVLRHHNDAEEWWQEVLKRSKKLTPFFPEMSSHWQAQASINLQEEIDV